MPASDIAGGKMHDSLQDFVSLAVNRTYQATGLDLSFLVIWKISLVKI